MGDVLPDDWKIVQRLEELSDIIEIHHEELETLNAISTEHQKSIELLYQLYLKLEKEVTFIRERKTPI